MSLHVLIDGRTTAPKTVRCAIALYIYMYATCSMGPFASNQTRFSTLLIKLYKHHMLTRQQQNKGLTRKFVPILWKEDATVQVVDADLPHTHVDPVSVTRALLPVAGGQGRRVDEKCHRQQQHTRNQAFLRVGDPHVGVREKRMPLNTLLQYYSSLQPMVV